MTMKHTVAATPAKAAHRSVSLQTYYDLVLLACLALALPVLVVLPLPLLRVPLGLALVIFAPGYALTAAIFARHDDLDGVTRLALSFGLSIALLPLLALVLDLSPWGIRLWPMTFSLAGWIGWWSVIAAARRSLLARHSAAMIPPPLELRSRWNGWSRRQRIAYTGSMVGISIMVLWIVVGLPALSARTPTTEFYVLGPLGMAEAYPRVVAPGSQMEVRLGLHNREGAPVTYRVEARSGAAELARIDRIQLDADAKWEQMLYYTLAQPGADQRIDILLFREAETTPYRHLQLWVDVQERLP